MATGALQQGDGGLLNTMAPFDDPRGVIEVSPDYGGYAQSVKEAVEKIPEPVRVLGHEQFGPAELQKLSAMLGARTTAQMLQRLDLSTNEVKFQQRVIHQSLGASNCTVRLKPP